MRTERLLQLNEVIQMTCLSRATIFRRMKERKFPLAIIPSPGVRRWKETEII